MISEFIVTLLNMKSIIRKLVISHNSRYWQKRITQIPDGNYPPPNSLRNVSKFGGPKQFGAPDEATYRIWTEQVCGIAALKTFTDYAGKTNSLSLYEMSQQARKFGTFIVPDKVEKPSDIIGAIHAGLETYIKSLGLKAIRCKAVSPEKIIYYLYEGWYFLASVNVHSFQNKPNPKNLSGKHIVLICGFEKKDGKITKLYYKDSATEKNLGRETDETDFEHFRKHFNPRGIFLKK